MTIALQNLEEQFDRSKSKGEKSIAAIHNETLGHQSTVKVQAEREGKKESLTKISQS